MSDERPLLPIKVCVRPRPLTQVEISTKAPKVIKYMNPKYLVIKTGRIKKRYTFDYVFEENADQLEIYEVAVAPFIRSVLAGYTCSFLTYGQTGTGKSYTLFGEREIDFCDFKDKSIGLILRAAEELFEELGKLDAETQYSVRVSFIEINHEQVLDLLDDSTPLRVYDDPLDDGSVCFNDLTQITVFNAHDVNDWVNIGRKTLKKSSYYAYLSHLMVTLFVDVKNGERVKTGRLNFVELAGSENAGFIAEQTTEEFAVIHKSLNVFGNVVKCLGLQLKSIPFRDSKLTRILQDSLNGSAKACIIATFSTSSKSGRETLNTLQIATLMKRLATFPHFKIAKTLTDASSALQEKIEKLESELADLRENPSADLTQEQVNNKIIELLREILELKQHKNRLESQYRKQNESFMRTKTYLEDAKAKQKTSGDKECLLTRLFDRNQEMIQNASRLLDICQKEISERIPPKVEAKNESTNLSTIVEVVTDTMRDVRQATKFHRRHQLNRVVNIAQFNTFLRRRFLGDLQQIADMMRRIRTLQPVDIYELLSSQARVTADHIAVYINGVYGEISQHLRIPERAKEELTQMKDGIISLTEEVTKTEGECRAEMDRNEHDRNEYFNVIFSFFEELLIGLDARETSIRTQLTEGRVSLENMKNEVRKILDEKKMLLEEASVSEEAMEFIRDQLEGRHSNNLYEEARQMMSVPEKMIFAYNDLNADDVALRFSNAVNDFYTECVSQQECVNDYADEVLSTLKSALAKHNAHNAAAASQIKVVGEGVQKNIFERAYINTIHIEQAAAVADQSGDDFVSKMKSLVGKTLKELELIENKIRSAISVREETLVTESETPDPENIENVAPPDENLPQGGEEDHEPEK
ncbi:kinesin-like protein KIF11-A isoform X2 [Tribolium madens]|uniref:kinesin-like protein KIF11-A isoform X2 n=1 Tax=Tribolium madens TaxID=41895 RepID=UPI001CF74484|nr:kinesin-like protein KIF11-A isoform X2 [Tribolium madens]